MIALIHCEHRRGRPEPALWSDQELVRLGLEAVCLLAGAIVASIAAPRKGAALGAALGFVAGAVLWIVMFVIQVRWFATWY